jgi:hypothetical protein
VEIYKVLVEEVVLVVLEQALQMQMAQTAALVRLHLLQVLV